MVIYRVCYYTTELKDLEEIHDSIRKKLPRCLKISRTGRFTNREEVFGRMCQKINGITIIQERRKLNYTTMVSYLL